MNSVEVYVRNVMRTSTGKTLVVGVPHNNESLSVSDLFETQYEVSSDDVLAGTPNPARLNVLAVGLVVEKIDVMRN